MWSAMPYFVARRSLILSAYVMRFICFCFLVVSLVVVGFLKSLQFSVLVILLILAELGCAAFIFFDKSWKEVSNLVLQICCFERQSCMIGCLTSFVTYFQEIPTDRTGDFDMIYGFLEEHWNIIKWVALGVVVLEV